MCQQDCGNSFQEDCSNLLCSLVAHFFAFDGGCLNDAKVIRVSQLQSVGSWNSRDMYCKLVGHLISWRRSIWLTRHSDWVLSIVEHTAGYAEFRPDSDHLMIQHPNIFLTVLIPRLIPQHFFHCLVSKRHREAHILKLRSSTDTFFQGSRYDWSKFHSAFGLLRPCVEPLKATSCVALVRFYFLVALYDALYVPLELNDAFLAYGFVGTAMNYLINSISL